MTWHEAFHKSPLARRLILWTIIFSSAVTLLLTMLQLYRDYRRDISQIEQNFSEIEVVHRATLTESLWATDKERLQLQLDGMLQLRDMHYLEVSEGSQIWAHAGQNGSRNIIRREIPLVYRHDGREQVLGTLVAVATLDNVYARLLGEALTILISNGLKTFLVALFMLLLIYYQVTRHLLAISRYAREFNLLEVQHPLILNRAQHDDELSMTVKALNQLQSRLSESVQKLAESEKRFRFAFEQAAVGVAQVSPDGRFLRVNKKLCEIVGFSQEELLTKTFQDITHPEDLDTDLVQMRHMLANDIKAYSMEKRYNRKDGRNVWVGLTVSLVRKADEKPDYFIAVMEDIQIRRDAQNKILRSANLLAEAQRIAHLGSFEWEAASGDLRWSDELYRIHGVSSQDFMPSLASYLACVHPDDRENVQAGMKAVLQDGKFIKYEERVLRPDGQQRLLVTELSPVTDDNGHVLRIIGASLDVTERKRTEAALRERNEIMRLFMQHAPAAMAMFDMDMRYIAVSHRWLIDYGLSERDLIGYCHYDVFPELPQHWKEIHKRCLAGATERCDEDPFVRSDGRTDWVKWEIRPWRTSNGAIGGIVIFSEVVTEHKLSQEALLQNEKKFRAIIDASPVPYALNDEQQNITYLNAAFVRTYGYTQEDIQTLADWWPRAYPDAEYRQWVADQWLEHLNKAQEHGGIFEPLELNIHCKDGSVKTVLVEAAAIGESWHGFHLVILYDITERKNNETESERIMGELNRRNVEMDAFIYTISHDLKSPLITIGGFSSLLEKDIARGDHVSVADSLQEIKKAVDLMQAHIRDLLLLSRTGRDSAEFTDVSLTGLLADVMGQFGQRFTEADAQIIIASDLPVIRADRKGLVRVYTNLIDNALKYRRPDIATRIEIGWQRATGELHLYVRDNGQGIKQEYQQRIFGLFQRIDSSIEGTGVGLAISKRVIEVHGGHMWVESEPGKGSTFWMALPLTSMIQA